MKSIHPVSGLAAAITALNILFAAGVGIALVTGPDGAAGASAPPASIEVPREWRWERPAVSFDGMLRRDRGHGR